MTSRAELSQQLSRFRNRFEIEFRQFLRGAVSDRLLRRQVVYAASLTGLRERAFLTSISAQLCRVSWRKALPLAIAAECFNASAFTADDVLDEAATRWGKPTLWSRYDRAQAWLVAEQLHALGQLVLADVEATPAATALRAAFSRLIEGQFCHLTCMATPTPAKTIELAMQRTGCLYEACLSAPALIQPSPFARPLAAFGRHFGTAFQLVDDILDFVGDPAVMGKPVLGDLLNGQPNIVLAHAFHCGNPKIKRSIRRRLGKGSSASVLSCSALIDDLAAAGSFQYAHAAVKRNVRRAGEALLSLPSGKHREALTLFLDLLVVDHETWV